MIMSPVVFSLILFIALVGGVGTVFAVSSAIAKLSARFSRRRPAG